LLPLARRRLTTIEIQVRRSGEGQKGKYNPIILDESRPSTNYQKRINESRFLRMAVVWIAEQRGRHRKNAVGAVRHHTI